MPLLCLSSLVVVLFTKEESPVKEKEEELTLPASSRPPTHPPLLYIEEGGARSQEQGLASIALGRRRRIEGLASPGLLPLLLLRIEDMSGGGQHDAEAGTSRKKAYWEHLDEMESQEDPKFVSWEE